VDGAEYDVLHGCGECLGKTPIILELHHEDILSNWEATVDLILNHCDVLYLDEQGPIPSQHPFGTSIEDASQLRADRVSYLLLE
jgi:hypothetical protein